MTFSWEADPIAALAKVRAGLCPECGLGPYRVVLAHMSMKHGQDRLTVRDRLGVATNDTLTPSDYHERRSELSRQMVRDGIVDPVKLNQMPRTRRPRQTRNRLAAVRAAAASRRGVSVKEPRTCEEDGCDETYAARGMCRKHYARWLRAQGGRVR